MSSLTPHPAGGNLPVMPAHLADKPAQVTPDRQPKEVLRSLMVRVISLLNGKIIYIFGLT